MNKKLKTSLVTIISIGLFLFFASLMPSQTSSDSAISESSDVFMNGTSEEIKKYLEKPGSVVNITSYYSLIRRDGYDILELLFEKYKLDPDFGFKNQGGTPLLFAAKHFKPKAVEILIKYGADVNYQDPYGVTPLIAAAYTTHKFENPLSLEITKMLVEAGADVNVVSKFGYTAIGGALSLASDNLDRVEYLVSNGAEVSYLDEDGSSYMFYCNTIKCVEYFISQGLDINHFDNTGENFIQSSALSRFDTISEIKQLLEFGVDICHLDSKENSILKHMDETGLYPQDTETKDDFYHQKVAENRQTEVYKYLEQEYQKHCLSEEPPPVNQ